jgi:hypothetical protein
MIKGNLHLTNCKASDANHAYYILLENGISVYYYNCKELPTDITKMDLDDFIEQYKGKEVFVEGGVVFEIF